MDSGNDQPLKDDAPEVTTVTTIGKATASKLMPSKDVREFSQRAPAIKSNRINLDSQLGTLSTTDSVEEDADLQESQPTEMPGDSHDMGELKRALLNLVEEKVRMLSIDLDSALEEKVQLLSIERSKRDTEGEMESNQRSMPQGGLPAQQTSTTRTSQQEMATFTAGDGNIHRRRGRTGRPFVGFEHRHED